MSDMKELDNVISDWVIETHRRCKVDLLDYASRISYEKRFRKYGLIIADELGYISFDKEERELLFTFISF
ncbi:hypothetical protein SAMN02745784_02161 [Tissierella praeacuta DSM 18095]|uniref:IstB-like ATP binding protein n=1 Tax=Tissierella praeacuta DSM 18095 TaxID=1123404 RepID=A0A1M4X955_9FIRM|nr:hypothetical protein [Tissierella praeacuta]SHE89956.1 hypothetical protein SAMN02745784_02161 [Tissierella praeacuta DSM 18095]SUP02529.1 Uncharacterised protein [Tissierella praeacuta]